MKANTKYSNGAFYIILKMPLNFRKIEMIDLIENTLKKIDVRKVKDITQVYLIKEKNNQIL